MFAYLFYKSLENFRLAAEAENRADYANAEYYAKLGSLYRSIYSLPAPLTFDAALVGLIVALFLR